MKTDGALGHTVCPLRGGFARGAEFLSCGLEWERRSTAEPFSSRVIYVPFRPRSGHIPRQAPRFPREEAGGREAAQQREKGEGAIAIVVVELCTSSRSRGRLGPAEAPGSPAGEPSSLLEGQLPGALLSTDGRSASSGQVF